jgi:hypothetical protein
MLCARTQHTSLSLAEKIFFQRSLGWNYKRIAERGINLVRTVAPLYSDKYPTTNRLPQVLPGPCLVNTYREIDNLFHRSFA